MRHSEVKPKTDFKRTIAVCLVAAILLFAQVLNAATKRESVSASLHGISNNSSLKSREGRPIVLTRFPSLQKGIPQTSAKYKFYIQGGLHGNEVVTTQFAYWMMDRLRKGVGPLSALDTSKVSFDFLPEANPDGLAARTRTNAKQVNLNRNFSFLWGFSRENFGASSFSEPETAAIKYILEREKYTAAIDIHGFVNWIVVPTTSAPQPNLQKNSSYLNLNAWISMLATARQKLNSSYEIKSAGELGDGGAFEDFAYWELGIPAVCLEMDSALRFEVRRDKTIGNFVRIDRFQDYEAFIAKVFELRINQLESSPSV